MNGSANFAGDRTSPRRSAGGPGAICGRRRTFGVGLRPTTAGIGVGGGVDAIAARQPNELYVDEIDAEINLVRKTMRAVGALLLIDQDESHIRPLFECHIEPIATSRSRLDST